MNAETLVQELANGPKIVSSLLAGVSPSEACLKPDPETWSLLEVVCHLTDEEREDFRVRLDLLLQRSKAAWPPIRPKEWVTERKYNQRDLAVMLASWTEEREKSLRWLQSLVAPDWEAEAPTPFGTVMKAGDMLAAWVAHDNLHTRQLVELRRHRLVKLAEPYHVEYAGDW